MPWVLEASSRQHMCNSFPMFHRFGLRNVHCLQILGLRSISNWASTPRPGREPNRGCDSGDPIAHWATPTDHCIQRMHCTKRSKIMRNAGEIVVFLSDNASPWFYFCRESVRLGIHTLIGLDDELPMTSLLHKYSLLI